MTTEHVYIVAGARTPMIKAGGAFKDVAPPMLGAVAARAALERSAVTGDQIDQVVFGQVLHTGGGAAYHARHMALEAGLPLHIPALAVNRLCGSGMQSVISAAQTILSGDAELVLAGGMESMSQAPHVIHGLRSGLRLGEGAMEDYLWAALTDSRAGCSMAATAENVAAKYGISREAQDAFAVMSQQRAASAWESGRFADEVVPVRIPTRKGTQSIDRDDHMRPESTVEKLAELPGVVGKTGTVTAGNASGIVDGAAALVIASERAVARHKLSPLGRLTAWATVGVEPSLMGLGPVPASRAALQRAGRSLEDVALIELNEAFAGQYLGVESELGLNRERVNVNGGAIALGHPLGMTGARQVLTLLLELRRRREKIGLATACIGGGQGIAVIVESVA